MRISPRILYSLLPLFMRAPMKMKILIGIVAVIGFFGWKMMGSSGGSVNFPTSDRQSHSSPSGGGSNLPVDDLSIGEALGDSQNSSPASADKIPNGKYERLTAQLISDKYNDGDSFKVKTDKGEILELRLYFVDTAESKDKPYADHRERVGKQGDYFGLNYDQAIQLGAFAKKYTTKNLAGKKLTILTSRELVYGGPRIYAFVYVDGIGWWHEHLVKNGLARIHTKGADMPDGTRWQKRKDILKRFENDARQNKRGAWNNQ